MVKNTNRIKKAGFLFIVLLMSISVFTACLQPGNDEPATGTVIKNVVNSTTSLGVVCYPDDEIYFHNFEALEEEDFSLFSTTVTSSAVNPALKDFSLHLEFAAPSISYESIISRQAQITSVHQDYGGLYVQGSVIAPQPDQESELFAITWKAGATAITTGLVKPISMTDTNGQPLDLPEEITFPLKIVEKAGYLSFNGPGSVKNETGFSNTIILDTEDKILKTYDWEITYDPAKLVWVDSTEAPGILPGADGFLDSVTHSPGKIHIIGTKESGLGPGTGLEFLQLNWSAIASGKTTISVTTHRTETTDSVLIKPDVRAANISIYKDNNKPIVSIWFEPDMIQVAPEGTFVTSVVLDTTGYVLGAYEINVLFDETKLAIDKSQAGGDGFETGSNGFLTIANPDFSKGAARAVGFDVSGKPPNTHLELFRIYWRTLQVSAVTEISLDIDTLSDIRTNSIDLFKTSFCTVVISGS